MFNCHDGLNSGLFIVTVESNMPPIVFAYEVALTISICTHLDTRRESLHLHLKIPIIEPGGDVDPSQS